MNNWAFFGVMLTAVGLLMMLVSHLAGWNAVPWYIIFLGGATISLRSSE